MTSLAKILAAIAIAVGTFFAARAAYLGYEFLRPAQFWDQLHSVGVYLAWLNGDYHVSQFWSFHNEHRILIPRLMSLIDAVYFDFSNRFLITSIYLGLFAVTLILAMLALKARTFSRITMMTMALLGIGWNIAQHENLTWGFQTAFILVYLFAFACFLCFAQMLATVSLWRQALWFALACVADALGMLSSAGGVLIGIAAPSMCLPARAWSRWVVAFIAVHLTAMGRYFIDMPSHPGSYGATLLENVQYFLYCLGSIARTRPSAAALVGLALLSIIALLTLGALREAKGRCASILFALIVFVVIETAATTVGRAGLGVDQALSSRYATQSAILVMGVLALCWRSVSNPLGRCATIAATILVTLLANGNRNIREMEDDIGIRDSAMFSFINGVYAPNQTSKIYADTRLVEREYGKLAELRKGPFALSATVYRPPLNSLASFDIRKLPDCRAQIDATTHYDTWSEIWGWIDASGWVLAYSDSGRLIGYTTSTIRRPDVALALSLPSDRLGFDLFLNKARIGNDSVKLIALAGAQPTACVLTMKP